MAFLQFTEFIRFLTAEKRLGSIVFWSNSLKSFFASGEEGSSTRTELFGNGLVPVFIGF